MSAYFDELDGLLEYNEKRERVCRKTKPTFLAGIDTENAS